jgi:hypothetical protein
MPRTNNRRLTLTTVGNNVTINVTYNAIFSVFERRLAGLGLVFRENIAVIGIDPAGANTGTVLDSINFENPNLAVTDGAAPQTIPRNVSVTVPRERLQEDADGTDEIRCRIQIEAVGLPPAVTSDRFTDQETLLG